MGIDPAQSSSSVTPSTDTPVLPAGSSANSLGSDAFLKLLVVQLQNQDPTSPQSNTEFIAQLATFSSLEQLTSINKAVSSMAEFLSAVNAVGNLADTAAAVEGKA